MSWSKKEEKQRYKLVVNAKAQNPRHVPELVSLDANHLTLQCNIHLSFHGTTHDDMNNLMHGTTAQQNATTMRQEVTVVSNNNKKTHNDAKGKYTTFHATTSKSTPRQFSAQTRWMIFLYETHDLQGQCKRRPPRAQQEGAQGRSTKCLGGRRLLARGCNKHAYLGRRERRGVEPRKATAGAARRAAVRARGRGQEQVPGPQRGSAQ